MCTCGDLHFCVLTFAPCRVKWRGGGYTTASLTAVCESISLFLCSWSEDGLTRLRVEDRRVFPVALRGFTWLSSPRLSSFLLQKSDSSTTLSPLPSPRSTSPPASAWATRCRWQIKLFVTEICQVCPPPMKGDKKDKNFLIEPSRRAFALSDAVAPTVCFSTKLHTLRASCKGKAGCCGRRRV